MTKKSKGQGYLEICKLMNSHIFEKQIYRRGFIFSSLKGGFLQKQYRKELRLRPFFHIMSHFSEIKVEIISPQKFERSTSFLIATKVCLTLMLFLVGLSIFLIYLQLFHAYLEIEM